MKPYSMKPRVLLAENNPIDHFIIYKMLTQLGCTVDSVENGFLVIDAVRNNDYHLVIASKDLPLLNGLEATRMLRQLPETHDLPVVMLLDGKNYEDIFRSRDAGVNDYVIAPVAGYKFREIFQEWLGTPVTPEEEPRMAVNA